MERARIRASRRAIAWLIRLRHFRRGKLDTLGLHFVNRGLQGLHRTDLHGPDLHQNPGRIAQRESVPFTRERSKVRSLVRPPSKARIYRNFCFTRASNHAVVNVSAHVLAFESAQKPPTDYRTRHPVRASILRRFRLLCSLRPRQLPGKTPRDLL